MSEFALSIPRLMMCSSVRSLVLTSVGSDAIGDLRGPLDGPRLDSDQYESVIGLIRISLKDARLWMIEQFWRGNH
jgi:hypothetical protein